MDQKLSWPIVLLLLVFVVGPLVNFVAQRKMVNDVMTEMSVPSASGSDIVFGGSKAKLAAIAARLQTASALPDDAPANNRALHIAVIEQLPDPPKTADKKSSPPKIVVNLASARDGAVLIVAPGPAIYRVENGGDQVAKIAYESPFAFDLENYKPGHLAGFRSKALGAMIGGAEPKDYLSSSGRIRSFCQALAYWRAHFGVAPEAMKIFIFNKPTRIDVLATALSGAPNPKSSPMWSAALECKSQFQSDYGDTRSGVTRFGDGE